MDAMASMPMQEATAATVTAVRHLAEEVMLHQVMEDKAMAHLIRLLRLKMVQRTDLSMVLMAPGLAMIIW